MNKPLLILLCLTAAVPSAPADWNNPDPVGTVAKDSAAPLIGTFYDFKQTPRHESTGMNRHIFEALIAQFIDSSWDEGLLSKYYRVSRPLYTTELQIPQMNSDYAPRAFGVDKDVKPMMWMVWYKAQVSAPEAGSYRFLGSADDFVAVAVNGKTVLVADIPGTRLAVKWFAKERTNAQGPANWQGYTAGDWIDLKAGQVIDIDIMTGDSPGGDYRCLLGIEKRGETGTQAVPFQLGVSKKTPPGSVPWKGIP